MVRRTWHLFQETRSRVAVHKLNQRRKTELVGDKSGEGTPGSISNPVVKFASADGTGGVALWESRSLPTGSVCMYLPATLLLFLSLHVALLRCVNDGS